MEAERETEGCKRRDRTLSSLTEGKRETHSPFAHCHMAIPRQPLLTTTCNARPVRVCLQDWQVGRSAQQRETVSKLHRKLGESCWSERASERRARSICRHGYFCPSVHAPLLPSVRVHMWSLDRVSGNAISVFRKPEIAELIHPSIRPGGWKEGGRGRPWEGGR